MIYLIDDKEKRQNSFGWTKDILKKHADILQPIYNSIELDQLSENIFSNTSNCVLLHESFFEASENKHQKNSIQIRFELVSYANKNPNFLLGIFSGSKNSRVVENNIAHLPVSLVYQNLEYFILKYKNGAPQLKYLLFGRNPEIEKVLASKFAIYKKLFSKVTLNDNISITNEINVLNMTQNKDLIIKDGMDVATFKKVIND
jgi:hypothetical protein